MKKLFTITALLFALLLSAQTTQTFNTQVRMPNLTVGVKADSIVTVNTNGLLRRVGSSSLGKTNISIGNRNINTLDIISSNGLGATLPKVTPLEAGLSSSEDKKQLINATYAFVEGQEYLWHFQNKIFNELKTFYSSTKIGLSGDSTTSGDGITDPLYKIDKQLLDLCLQNGLQGSFPIEVLNLGHSGAATFQWNNTHVDSDKNLDLDLYILRWGINDPGFLKNGNPAPLDAGANFPNRRDPQDVKTALISGLTKFRALNPYETCSVILMMPNSTNDAPNGRYAPYYEQLIPIYKEVARQFKCAFIDTYSFMKDVSNAAGFAMDNPFGDGRAIHPKEVMTSNIAGLIFETIAPKGILAKLGRSNVTNTGGVTETKLVTDLPSTYPFGISIKRATETPGGFPLDGIITTIHNVDYTLLQIISNWKDSEGSLIKMRMGNSLLKSGATNSWQNWVDVGGYLPLTGGNVTGSISAIKATINGGGVTTSLSNINQTANTHFTLANPPINIAVGYLNADNGYIQSYNSSNQLARILDINPFGGIVKFGGGIAANGLPIHANNADAITAGLTAGVFYHNGDGILRVVF